MRALEIAKKDKSIFIAEVIINFCEWMYRNDFDVEEITKSLDYV